MPSSNRKEAPQHSPSERSSTDTYRRAIQHTGDQAFAPPAPLDKQKGKTEVQWEDRLIEQQKADLAAWREGHRWHRHQLRDNAAT